MKLCALLACLLSVSLDLASWGNGKAGLRVVLSDQLTTKTVGQQRCLQVTIRFFQQPVRQQRTQSQYKPNLPLVALQGIIKEYGMVEQHDSDEEDDAGKAAAPTQAPKAAPTALEREVRSVGEFPAFNADTPSAGPVPTGPPCLLCRCLR